jgi:hypothetical protein
MRNKRWKDFTPTEQKAIAIGGALQLVLLAAALNDLRLRPSEKIRGGKRLWVPAVFLNFVGPIAYFLIGRKR